MKRGLEVARPPLWAARTSSAPDQPGLCLRDRALLGLPGELREVFQRAAERLDIESAGLEVLAAPGKMRRDTAEANLACALFQVIGPRSEVHEYLRLLAPRLT